jgi:hypothetical protein
MSTAPARRAHPPLQNGAGGDDGDDEREEEEEEEEEEVGDDEEEPRLKYQRLGGSVPAILSTDAAAAIAVADRMVALGTHNGTLHILDFQGNQVPLATRRFLLAELGHVMGMGEGVASRETGSWHWDCSRSFLYACWVKTTCQFNDGALRDFISETDLERLLETRRCTELGLLLASFIAA